jgi:hypothetical protein
VDKYRQLGKNIPRERKEKGAKNEKRGQTSGHRNNLIVDYSQGIMNTMKE